MKAGIMLNTFIDWAQQIAVKPLGHGVAARVAEIQISDNPSARLDIDTPTTVARITFWESGDYDVEAIDIDSEKTLFSDHGQLRDEQVFSEQFAAFFRCLGIKVE